MNRPEDISKDVWDHAEIALKFVPSGNDEAQIASVARAIMAECEQVRERCARIAESARVRNQGGYVVAINIAAAIRKGETS